MVRVVLKALIKVAILMKTKIKPNNVVLQTSIPKTNSNRLIIKSL